MHDQRNIKITIKEKKIPSTVLNILYILILRMEKISWTDHVRNEEVLLTVKEKRNILHEINIWKANWIGHILHRNCLLQQVIEGKLKGG